MFYHMGNKRVPRVFWQRPVGKARRNRRSHGKSELFSGKEAIFQVSNKKFSTSRRSVRPSNRTGTESCGMATTTARMNRSLGSEALCDAGGHHLLNHIHSTGSLSGRVYQLTAPSESVGVHRATAQRPGNTTWCPPPYGTVSRSEDPPLGKSNRGLQAPGYRSPGRLSGRTEAA